MDREQDIIDDLQKESSWAVSVIISEYMGQLYFFGHILTGERDRSGQMVDRVVERLLNERLPFATIPLWKYFVDAIRKEYEERIMKEGRPAERQGLPQVRIQS